MKTIKEPSRSIPVAAEADIAVLGGGPAGFVAATAAARLGAKVLLIERYGCLGGLASGGLVLHMMAIFGGHGKRWIGGLPWEMLERLEARGGLYYDTPTRPFADSELFKVVAEELCLQAGVKLHLHTWAVDVVLEDGRLKGVVTESKSGRRAVLARCFIDATGDADIAAAGGAGCSYASMPIGLPVKVGGVDIEAYRAFQEKHPEKAAELKRQVTAQGGFPLQPRTIPGSSAGIYWINIWGISERETEKRKLNPLDPADITYAELELRRKVADSLDYYRKHAPGFEAAYLVAFASQLGVRESRHVNGLYTLGVEGLGATGGEPGHSFPDAVGTVAAHGDMDHLTVPYRCLLPDAPEGLLVAGRCISVEPSVADIMRLIPPCIVTGQAAGTAAALALSSGTSLRDLEGSVLKQQLLRDGVVFA